MEEEFPREKEGGNTENTINTTHDNNNSMFLLNDSNLERESVDRILKFIDNNKQIFEPFGLSKLVEKSIIQQKQLDNNKNINKVDKIEIENNNDRNTNFIPKSHVNNKEINSSIAKKKVNFSALKDKIQKECQSAITDINSNRIIQAKTDLQNALNLLRTYKE